MGILLPVLAIKLNHPHGGGTGVEAIHVNIYPIGVGTRDIKWLDTTNPAKTVLGHATIEGVGAQLLRTCKQAELAAGHNQVQVAGLGADRAIAILNLYIFIGFYFKFDRTTVSASVIEHDSNSALN
jgi:hypothetical protein